VGVEFPDAVSFPAELSGLELLCCVAKDERVVGEGTALAVASSDCGRERSGKANDLAKAVKEGNVEGEVTRFGEVVASFALTAGAGVVAEGEETTRSFRGGAGGGVDGGDGVFCGGGCPSDVSHASRAAFSSSLARGSNSFNTS